MPASRNTWPHTIDDSYTAGRDSRHGSGIAKPAATSISNAGPRDCRGKYRARIAASVTAVATISASVPTNIRNESGGYGGPVLPSTNGSINSAGTGPQYR